MRVLTVGGLKVRLAGGMDGSGSGKGPAVILVHGYGAPGDDLVVLAEVLGPCRSTWGTEIRAPGG
jgi:phospholipase/carboxylesterase